jgi:hypothetical protein
MPALRRHETPALTPSRPVIRIGDRRRSDVEAALLAMDLRLPCHGMAHVELRLQATPTRRGTPFLDLVHGTPIAITYDAARSEPVFAGEITAIEIRMGEGPPELVLLAEDALHRLARRMLPRSFEDVTVDAVVEFLAHDAGLQTEVTLGGPVETFVKGTESDLAFLLRLLAARGGSLRLVDGRIRAGPEAGTAPVVAIAAASLTGLRLIADLNWQPGAVTVRGLNLAQAATVEATATPDPAAGQAQSGAALAGVLGWSAGPVVVRDRIAAPVAAAIALARATGAAGRFVHGEIVATAPGPVPGGLVEITGTDPRFAGRYRVGDCRHRFSGATGLRIRAEVTRPDWHP